MIAFFWMVYITSIVEATGSDELFEFTSQLTAMAMRRFFKCYIIVLFY